MPRLNVEKHVASRSAKVFVSFAARTSFTVFYIAGGNSVNPFCLRIPGQLSVFPFVCVGVRYLATPRVCTFRKPHLRRKKRNSRYLAPLYTHLTGLIKRLRGSFFTSLRRERHTRRATRFFFPFVYPSASLVSVFLRTSR